MIHPPIILRRFKNRLPQPPQTLRRRTDYIKPYQRSAEVAELKRQPPQPNLRTPPQVIENTACCSAANLRRNHPLITPPNPCGGRGVWERPAPLGLRRKKCMAFEPTRSAGENPRALSINPRATETNPRARGTNPNAGNHNKHALRIWKRQQKKGAK